MASAPVSVGPSTAPLGSSTEEQILSSSDNQYASFLNGVYNTGSE